MTVPTTVPDPTRLGGELEFLSQLCQVVASTTDFQTVHASPPSRSAASS